MGRPHQRQPCDAPAGAGATRRGGVAHQWQHRTCPVPVAVPILMKEFGIGMPALPLEPSLSGAGNLARYAGVYAWPDERWTVTPGDTDLVVEHDGVAARALPLDDSTSLVDADDPDNPTVTFTDFDASGRPPCSIRCCGDCHACSHRTRHKIGTVTPDSRHQQRGLFDRPLTSSWPPSPGPTRAGATDLTSASRARRPGPRPARAAGCRRCAPSAAARPSHRPESRWRPWPRRSARRPAARPAAV